MNTRLAIATAVSLLALLLPACSDTTPENVAPVIEPKTEAQLLREQLGAGADLFTDEGMRGILDFEDTGSPVTLLQLISVTNAEGFSDYETEAEAVWQSVGAQSRFASKVFARIIGERTLVEIRAIEFPNITMLLDVMITDEFAAVMETLFAASDDHAWVLGVETVLPLAPSGSYFDPALQNIDSVQAEELLQANGGDSTLEADTSVIVDMIVSDSPGPFWMVNLIDFFDQAQYSDGRESELTGVEANEIYGQAILPTLLAYNSFPELVMPIGVILTGESVDWEQAAIVRYASRDAFLNIFPLNPHSGDALVHKEAGVEHTLVYATEVESELLPEPVNGFLYNFRYCEVLLTSFDNGRVRADVYNSIGQSTCPQDQWDALDAQVIAAEYGAEAAILNGIRFWVLDRIVSNAPAEPNPVIEQFGDISMRLVASALLPAEAAPGTEAGYQVAQVDRDTVFFYSAGRQVYELQDPEGQRFLMQSFSRVVDKDLQLEDLQLLGRRLQLPPGWAFSTRILDSEFALPTVDGVADVVTDDLNNTYQRIP